MTPNFCLSATVTEWSKDLFRKPVLKLSQSKSADLREAFLPRVCENVKTVSRTFTSSREAKKIIAEFKPDICIGTGGYVSGPVIRTAAKMGIPCIIHEQNAYPGITNKMLAKSVKKVMLAVPDAKEMFDKNR